MLQLYLRSPTHTIKQKILTYFSVTLSHTKQTTILQTEQMQACLLLHDGEDYIYGWFLDRIETISVRYQSHGIQLNDFLLN
jgi:hypothetical protein